jgi:hypothetical protein
LAELKWLGAWKTVRSAELVVLAVLAIRSKLTVWLALAVRSGLTVLVGLTVWLELTVLVEATCLARGLYGREKGVALTCSWT